MISKQFEKYDEELLKGRVETEASVIGCIMNDLLLLEDVKLKIDDFATKDGRFYFNIADTLRKKNINEVTEVDIIANFNEQIVDKFEEKGGMNQVELMKSMISNSNFEGYIDELYKYNIMLSLSDLNIDLTKPVEFNGKEIIPVKEFRKMDAEMVVDFYENYINNLNTVGLKRGVEEEEIDIDDEFIESCYAGEESGVPIDMCGKDVKGEDIYGFKALSERLQGFMPGTLSFLGGYSSVGKSTMLTSMLSALMYNGEKCVIISNEQKVKPFKMNFLMWILCNKLRYYKITKKKLMSGEVTDEDKQMILKAQKLWREEYKGKIYFVGIPNADMKLVKKKIREYHLTKGITTYVYDTFKADMSGEHGDNNWLNLIKDSRELHEVARKYDLIGIATMQLAMNSLGTLFLTPNVLSQSRQVVEVLENLLLMRNVYPDELDKNNKKLYCNPYRYEKDSNGKWKETPIELDLTKDYRMLFVGKCRSGQNSLSGNFAMLLNFNGSQGIVSEVCYCRPKHGSISAGKM